jgi:nucleolar MIF4G domain-containing protein 1
MSRSGQKGLAGGACVTQGGGAEEEGGGEHEASLRKLAATQKMGTDVRKAIFMVIMDSEDYLDATEKLLRLGLQVVLLLLHEALSYSALSY